VARVARVRVLDAGGRETSTTRWRCASTRRTSYTGEDVAEISAHGNPLLLEGIVRAAMRAGARLAAPASSRFARF
jgi:hypothetical protein